MCSFTEEYNEEKVEELCLEILEVLKEKRLIISLEALQNCINTIINSKISKR